MVADIFRDHAAAWRSANRGHVTLGQLKLMSAIECCRTAALGGHVARCENEACRYTSSPTPPAATGIVLLKPLLSLHDNDAAAAVNV